MQIDTSRLRVSTKTLVSGFMAFGALMQVPAVSQLVLQMTSRHPHIATLVASLTGIALLLHNPEVQDVLGIKSTTQVTQTTESVVIAKDQP